MAAFPPWVVSALPLLAVVLAILLVVLTVIAIRRSAAPAATPAPPPAEAATEPPMPVAAQIRRATERLSALYGGRHQIDAVPLLIAVGAGSAALQRMIPKVGAGDLTRAQLDLSRGDCRILVSPDGAVVSFEDGLLGSERWETRWAELLRALSKHREDRPFDGLVVVLTAAQLAGPTKLDDDALTMLSERLYQLLWTAQRTGGWRVPIYLLLNECEALNGFTATAAELPEPMRREPFGWSVPYALDTAFERSWIREGIEALTARLSTLQLRLLSGLKDPNRAEPVLLFPNALARLAEPLALLLTPMLQPSAYHDAFMFRGFYLTGSEASAALGGPDLFAAQLFAKRIFPEQFLAQPARGAVTRRQRQIRIAQCVFAVLVLLALAGLIHVRHHREALKTVSPLVQEIAALGERAQSARSETARAVTANSPLPAQSEQRGIEDTKALVEAMAAVSLNRLETPWAPLSYFTNVSTEVEQAIREAYQVEVLRTVYSRLTDAIPALLGVRPPAGDDSPGELAGAPGDTACAANGATSADVAQLAQITRRLSVYRQELQNYQDLPANPQIGNLESLLEFTLAVSLPAGFNTNYYLYENALRGARAPLLDIGPIRTTVGMILRAQFARGLAGAYPGSALGLAVSEVIANAGVYGGDAQTVGSIGRLRRLDLALHTAQAQTSLPEYAWILDDHDAASISSELDQLTALSASGGGAELAPVASNLPAELRRSATDCVTRTREWLLAARVFGGEPVLTAGPTSLQVSAPLKAIDQTLDLFLAQPLVADAMPSARAWPLALDGSLLWDPQDLQSLQAVAESWLLFVGQDLPATLPAEFREQVQAAAGERLDLLAANVVARAQQAGLDNGASAQPGSTAALRDEMARFADAAPILINLRTLLRGAGRTNSADRLDQLLAGQAIRLLRQIDALLNAADPYALVDGNLAFWSGTPPLAAPAFGSATLPELVGTLPARRDYVEALARDNAAPMITYLQQSGVLLSSSDRALLTRWQAIISTLDRYHRSVPGNSLSRLEQFISTDMDHIDLGDCRQITAAFSGGADWFAVQLGTIGRAVRNRCNQVAHGESVAQYDNLAESFNHDLAGRFPFGAVTAPDADLTDVKRFYNRFGGKLATLREQLAGIPAYARAGAPQFVDQLLAVQLALAPMLTTAPPDASLTYDVTVEFRTNIGSDPGADQMLEATAEFGQQRLSSFATTNDLAWSNGQRVRMILHWAKDAPEAPVSGGAQSPRVRGLAVTYEYRGPWALLRMIAAQRPSAAVMAQLSDRRPETIGFVVPLQRNAKAAGATSSCGFWCSSPAAASVGPANLTTAQVFMRFGLTATIRVAGQPDKRQPVSLPIFPTAAPQLDDQTAAPPLGSTALMAP
ncbi:MAG TPA: type VI secretion system protein [Candidatus Binataceae bacterium]|nr:type VI secretion system protein [Candidatus Binataceae bacterium]